MNRINKLLDKLKSDINDTKDIDNDWFVEQALTTLDELKKQWILYLVVKRLRKRKKKMQKTLLTVIGLTTKDTVS